MSDFDFVAFPPRVSLFKTNGQVPEGTLLPIHSVENKKLNSVDLIVAPLLTLPILIDAYSNRGFSALPNFVFLAMALVGAIMIWRSMRDFARVSKQGPIKLSIQKEGLIASTVFDGVLRWSDMASIIVNHFQGRVYSAVIRLESGDKNSGAGHRELIWINLRNFSDANLIGQAMIGAANKYSGKHIGNLDLPLPRFSA